VSLTETNPPFQVRGRQSSAVSGAFRGRWGQPKLWAQR